MSLKVDNVFPQISVNLLQSVYQRLSNITHVRQVQPVMTLKNFKVNLTKTNNSLLYTIRNQALETGQNNGFNTKSENSAAAAEHSLYASLSQHLLYITKRCRSQTIVPVWVKKLPLHADMSASLCLPDCDRHRGLLPTSMTHYTNCRLLVMSTSLACSEFHLHNMTCSWGSSWLMIVYSTYLLTQRVTGSHSNYW